MLQYLEDFRIELERISSILPDSNELIDEPSPNNDGKRNISKHKSIPPEMVFRT
jgi:hypothetical protein